MDVWKYISGFFKDVLGPFRKDQQGLMIAVMGLVFVGCINIYSSTYVKDILSNAGFITYFTKHVISLGIGLFIGLFIYFKLDYRFFKNPNFLYVFVGLTIAALFFIIFFGTVVNGARRWFHIGGFSIQPSEFAKVACIFAAAAAGDYQLRMKKKISFLMGKPYFLNIGIWPAIICGVEIIREPDMGTALLVFLFAAAVLVVAGISMKEIFSWTGPMLLGILLVAYMAPYRFARLQGWLHPWKYQQDLGYQTVQSLISVGSGGIWGQAFGQGTSKYFFLPEAHTDFAFAVWGQEWGFVGVLFVVFLVLLFTFYGLRIASKAPDYFGSLLAFGLTILIGGQALFNMLMVVGVLPVTGVPLPFVSYGGTSMIINCISIAILVSIGKATDDMVKARGQRGPLPSLREEVQSRYKPNT